MKHTKQELADIYRRAAWLVESGQHEYSCLAVRTATGVRAPSETIPEVRLYIKTMGLVELWPGYVNPICCDGDLRKIRVDMLNLMAEWVLTDWNGEIP